MSGEELHVIGREAIASKAQTVRLTEALNAGLTTNISTTQTHTHNTNKDAAHTMPSPTISEASASGIFA